MRKQILIVDDDWGICNSLTLLLRGEGYSVHSTTSSKQAAVLVNENRYAICLFDYKMKGLNGIDLLKLTKQVNPQCRTYIISGMLNIDELCSKEVKACLVAGIIHKPFDVERLLQEISAILKGLDLK